MEVTIEGEEVKFFGPLTFGEPSVESYIQNLFVDELVPCLLCEDKFTLPSKNKDLIEHLFDNHRLLVSDLHNVIDIKSYFKYWKGRFSSAPLTELCHVIEEPYSSQNSYILGEFLKEDKALREQLQQKRLQGILACQEKERQDETFSKECLFCKTRITGTRAGYFTHLTTFHNLKIGHHDNLVFTDELIEQLRKTLERLQCIFCEKFFKNRDALKEHMRKKKHKSINPNNKSYDKFYAVNYLEIGRNWREIRADKDSSDSCTDSDSEEEEAMASGMPFDATGTVTCLFCNEISASFEDALEHMDSGHEFDYSQIVEDYHLSFYEQVKLVNFIRHQMYSFNCMKCNKHFENRGDLLNHMTEQRHFIIPKKETWNQPEYYFPTYENDNFLCNLDADEGLTKRMKTCNTNE